MIIPSKRALTEVCRAYRRHCGIPAYPVSPSGALINERVGNNVIFAAPCSSALNAYSLQEALHWGEPYIFYWTPSVMSWSVAMVEGNSVWGGLLSGPVRSNQANGETDDQAARSLIERGIPSEAARGCVARLPIWSPQQTRDTAIFLQDTFYQVTGWKPLLLEQNRIKAFQQRQIAAAIEEQKKHGLSGYPIDKERMLLSAIKAGDRNAARRMLNEMLAAMFLFSPRLPLLRARSIEMMGYLTRAAVEDNHLMEPLIERNHQWMQKLIKAADFESLSQLLMQALDDFMDGIYAQGFNCYNHRTSLVLDYISRHYAEKISLKDIADEVGLSRFRLSHLVKASTGRSVMQHVMRMRVQKAQQLLERTSMPCAEIAHEVGFCDQSYFVKQFKKISGVTPAKYRRGRFEAEPS